MDACSGRRDKAIENLLRMRDGQRVARLRASICTVIPVSDSHESEPECRVRISNCNYATDHDREKCKVDKETRNRIQRATQAARALLEREYAEQLGSACCSF